MTSYSILPSGYNLTLQASESRLCHSRFQQGTQTVAHNYCIEINKVEHFPAYLKRLFHRAVCNLNQHGVREQIFCSISYGFDYGQADYMII